MRKKRLVRDCFSSLELKGADDGPEGEYQLLDGWLLATFCTRGYEYLIEMRDPAIRPGTHSRVGAVNILHVLTTLPSSITECQGLEVSANSSLTVT